MAFKYVNPGYGELFDKNILSTTVNKNCNPNNGVCISAVYAISPAERIKLPNNFTDIWINVTACVFDIYSDSVNTFVIKNGNKSTGLKIKSNNSYLCLIVEDGEVSNTAETFPLTKNRVYKITLHIKKGVNGLMELFVDSVPVLTYTGQISCTTNWLSVGCSRSLALSNFIVADYDISSENVAVCDLKDLTGTWEGISDGLAKATDVNQTLSQKIDINKLKSDMENYSSNPTITSISISATGIRYDTEKVNSIKTSITQGTSDVFNETKYIDSGLTISPSTYIKNISTDTLENMTLNLTSVKQ